MIIDSISDGAARVEDEQGRLFTLPDSWLPDQCHEGSVLSVSTESTSDGIAIRIAIDHRAEAERQTTIADKLDRLRKRDQA